MHLRFTAMLPTAAEDAPQTCSSCSEESPSRDLMILGHVCVAVCPAYGYLYQRSNARTITPPSPPKCPTGACTKLGTSPGSHRVAVLRCWAGEPDCQRMAGLVWELSSHVCSAYDGGFFCAFTWGWVSPLWVDSTARRS